MTCSSQGTPMTIKEIIGHAKKCKNCHNAFHWDKGRVVGVRNIGETGITFGYRLFCGKHCSQLEAKESEHALFGVDSSSPPF